jgi:hypothetical protein
MADYIYVCSKPYKKKRLWMIGIWEGMQRDLLNTLDEGNIIHLFFNSPEESIVEVYEELKLNSKFKFTSQNLDIEQCVIDYKGDDVEFVILSLLRSDTGSETGSNTGSETQSETGSETQSEPHSESEQSETDLEVEGTIEETIEKRLAKLESQVKKLKDLCSFMVKSVY